MAWQAARIDTDQCCIHATKPVLCSETRAVVPQIACAVLVSMNEIYAFDTDWPMHHPDWRGCTEAEQRILNTCNEISCGETPDAGSTG